MLISKSRYLSLFNVFFFLTKYFIIFGKDADQGHRGLPRTKDHILYSENSSEWWAGHKLPWTADLLWLELWYAVRSSIHSTASAFETYTWVWANKNKPSDIPVYKTFHKILAAAWPGGLAALSCAAVFRFARATPLPSFVRWIHGVLPEISFTSRLPAVSLQSYCTRNPSTRAAKPRSLIVT